MNKSLVKNIYLLNFVLGVILALFVCRMIYTRASILEIHRRVSMTPLGIPHSNFTAAKVCGVRIPANSFILMNVWNAHHDETKWPDPFTFKPERFIGSDGQKLVNSDQLLNFSIGTNVSYVINNRPKSN